ncbi:MAG: DUF2255 family protein [Galbitalea sp.]
MDINWPTARITEFDSTDELGLVIGRVGHDILRLPVWVVTVDGAVYVRSYRGVTSVWFRRVQADADQAVTLAGRDIPVRFENVDRLDHVNHAIDAAFAHKYARFDYVTAMSEPAAVEATLRILPR